jgi:hypothetical protein
MNGKEIDIYEKESGWLRIKVYAEYFFPKCLGDKTKSRFYDGGHQERTLEEVNWPKEIEGFWPERGRAD